MSNPMADDEEFASFLRTATPGMLGEQSLRMLASIEDASDGVQKVEWSRVVDTLKAYAPHLARDREATREIGFAIRAAELFAEVDAKLAAMAAEQHGN